MTLSLRAAFAASLSAAPDDLDLFGTLLDAASTIKLAGETVYACDGGHPAFSNQALRDAKAAATTALRAIAEYEAGR